MRTIARVIDGRRVTFLANPTGEELVLRLFAPHPLVGWDPVDVRRVALEPLSGDGSDAVGSAVVLAPFASLFVMEDAPVQSAAVTRVALAGEWRAELPGMDPIVTSPHPGPWTDAGHSARSFSGIGVYRHDFALTATQAAAPELLLAFDEVHDIARVVLNDQHCGVAWTSSFRVGITAAARRGRNRLEIHVATPWRNRLIAEAAVPTGEMFEPMTAVFDPSAAPRTAGLSGAVAVLIGS